MKKCLLALALVLVTVLMLLVPATAEVVYQDIDYIELDCKQYQNFKLPYYIPTATTSYEWEMTLSDITKSNACGSFMGIYNPNTNSRSGYICSVNQTSTEAGHVGEQFFQVCVGVDLTGPKFYLLSNPAKNTIHAAYTSNGSGGTYSVYDTNGMIADKSSPVTGTWTGKYAYGPDYKFSIVNGADFEKVNQSSEFLSLKVYGVKIWDDNTTSGSKELKLDMVPKKMIDGTTTSVGLYDKVSGTFTGMTVYSNVNTITFDNQGADIAAGTASITAGQGMEMTTITPPQKTGKDFDGYYTGTNGSGTKYFDMNGKPLSTWNLTADTTLYANWVEYVAYIDNGTSKVYYTDLQTAINAAAAGTTTAAQTVVLCRDLTYTASTDKKIANAKSGAAYYYTLLVPSGKTVILDLNGKTINYKQSGKTICSLLNVESSATITVKNGTIAGDMAIGSTDAYLKAFNADASSTMNIQCDVVGVGHVVSFATLSSTATTITVGDGTSTPVYFAASNSAYALNQPQSTVTISSPLIFLWSYPGSSGGNDKVWNVKSATFTETSAGTAFKLEPQKATYVDGISLKYTADKTSTWAGKSYSTPFEVVKLTSNMTSGIYRLSAEELTKYVATGYVVKKVSTPTGALSSGTWYEITPFTPSDYTARTKIGTGAVTDGTWSYYATLQEAITAATDSSATAIEVQLLKDTAEDVTVESTKNIILDLNGRVLKGTGSSNVIVNEGNLIITDSNATAVHYFTVGSDGLWTLNTTATSGTPYDTLTARPSTGDIIKVTGGCITGGQSGLGGGVKVITSSGSLTLTGGNIVGNKATSMGGGLGVDDYASITMNGGRILGNVGGGNGGGGVAVDGPGAALTMNGGDISFNTAQEGGGVTTGVTFKMTGGKITNNMATTACGYGGGVEEWGSEGVGSIITGGTISDNIAAVAGGGVYVWNSSGYSGILTLGGDEDISDNTRSDGTTADNVYLATGKVITLGTKTSGSEGNGAEVPTWTTPIGVTTETAPTAGNPVAVTNTNAADYSSYFTSDNASYAVINDGNVVKLSVAVAYIDNGTTEVYYSDLQTAINAAAAGTTTAAQTVVLCQDLSYTQTSSCSVSVPAGKTVTLDLNEHTINYTKGSYTTALFYANQNANFTVKNGTLSGNVAIGTSSSGDFDAFHSNAPCNLNIQCDVVKFGHAYTNKSAETSTEYANITIGDGTDTPVVFATASNCWAINCATAYHKVGVTVTSPLKFLHSYSGGVWDSNPAKFEETSVGSAFLIEPNNATYAEGLSLKYTADKTTEYEGTQYATPFEVVKLTTNMTSGIYRMTSEELLKYVADGYVVKKVSTPTGALSGGTWYEITPFNPSDYTARTKIGNGTVTDGTWSYYATLQEAITAATDSSATAIEVQLLKDTNENVTVASGKNIILDLNDHVLKGTGTTSVIKNSGNLTLTDSSKNPTTRNFKIVSKLGVETTEAATVSVEDLKAYPSSTDVVAITGGVITGGNGSSYGGGIYNGGTLTMNGGTIFGNMITGTSNWKGAGVYVGNSKTFTMNGGIIAGNNCYTGAGVQVDGTFIMNDGLICGNTASLGGGVNNDRTTTILGGTITGNTASNGGGLRGWGTVTIGGSANITGNTSDGTNANNVFAGNRINISTTTVPTADMKIGIHSGSTPTAGNPVAVTNTNAADYSSHFTSDNASYVVINDGNVVKLKAPDQAKVVDKDGNETIYPLLTTAVANVKDGDTIYMLTDVNLGSAKHQLQIAQDATLDLGGHTLTGSDVVDATNGATVRVTNGTIKSNDNSSCVGVTGASGTLYVDNVTLSGYNAFYAEKATTHTYLGEGVKTDGLNSLYSSNGSGVLHITDGVYNTNKLDCEASATAGDKIFITGGCFKYNNVAGTLPNYVADGYKAEPCTHGRDGYYDVVIDPTKDNGVELKHIDAQGNETVTKFNSLQDAINAAAEGDVIEITKDITENITVPNGKDIVIDLKGNTVTAKDATKPVINNKGTLILTDSVGGGDLTGGKSGVEQNGTLSVGGKLDLTGDGNTNGNIYLPKGKIVDPATVPYAPNGMKIGVTTEEQPEGDNPVKITSESAADTSSYFTSDEDYAVEDLVVGDKHYAVIYGVRKIVLTSSSASKTYDGLPLTKAEVRVTEGNFMEGDSFTYVCTGSMTNVGCATNEFTYTLSVKSKLKYEVTCEFGTLTVEPVPGKNLQPDADDLRAETEKLIEENPGSTISVWMEINRDVPNKDKLTLQYKTSGKQSIFYQANIYAKIDGETTDIGDTNETVIGVTSKFYFAGRKDIHVYRLHNGTDVDELTETPNANGEYVIFDTANDQIIVKAMKYSTFCFVWKGEPPRTGDNTNLWLYVGMAAVSVLGVATIVVSKKKRRG